MRKDTAKNLKRQAFGSDKCQETKSTGCGMGWCGLIGVENQTLRLVIVAYLIFFE